MGTIKFDSTCAGWTNNPELNKAYLELQRNHVFDTIHFRGYVYLNYIYEAFGVEWDTDRDNPCYRMCDEGLGILFEPAEDNTYLIQIFG